MSNNNDWLKTVKEGDNVFYEYGGFAGTTLKPVVIERVTKTQIVVNRTKYRLDGTEVGANSYHKYLLPYTDENKHIYTIQEKRRSVDKQWDELQKIVKPRYIPEDKLGVVAGIMEQLKKVVEE